MSEMQSDGLQFKQVDISELESRAYSLQQVLFALGPNALDVYDEMLEDIQDKAFKKFGNFLFGVSSGVYIGCSMSDMDGEVIKHEPAPFIGSFSDAKTVVAPLESMALAESGGRALVPSLLFEPHDTRDVSLRLLERYPANTTSLYRQVAVPLVGGLVVLEQICPIATEPDKNNS